MPSLFERTLTTAAMAAVFDDEAILQDMLAFEAALAEAQAAEDVIPAASAAPIVAACRAAPFDAAALVADARSAGSLAIPLVRELRRRIAAGDAAAATCVHWGSTSQDVIDTAMVLATRRALVLIETDLDRLIASLRTLAERHLATPMLARTLLQPAQVISVGFKVVAWLAPLVRARVRLRRAAAAALQLQFGGAVGTLSALHGRGEAVARRLAAKLGLPAPDGAWATQRDRWVGLGCEVALLCGSLGKIGRDLALLAQAEVAEVAEPAAPGRGGSSAMPNKRNPIAALVAIAAATRAPHHAAALLATMPQEHERGLGNWQAELAEWPALFLAAHGALDALADACAGLEVDTARMRANIEAGRGTAFAEAASTLLAAAIGRAAAHERIGRLSRQAVVEGRELRALLDDAIANDAELVAVTAAALDAAFDIDAAGRQAATVATLQLKALRREETGA
ncbi:MAG: 3-carboxy-cis,cis-muconate cycloisomerase [Caldimonas sp.]